MCSCNLHRCVLSDGHFSHCREGGSAHLSPYRPKQTGPSFAAANGRSEVLRGRAIDAALSSLGYASVEALVQADPSARWALAMASVEFWSSQHFKRDGNVVSSEIFRRAEALIAELSIQRQDGDIYWRMPVDGTLWDPWDMW